MVELQPVFQFRNDCSIVLPAREGQRLTGGLNGGGPEAADLLERDHILPVREAHGSLRELEGERD
jgi:hypothetical protein